MAIAFLVFALQVAVKAVGLNFRDVLNVLGMYPGDPGAPGADCAGVVMQVGQAVGQLSPGKQFMPTTDKLTSAPAGSAHATSLLGTLATAKVVHLTDVWWMLQATACLALHLGALATLCTLTPD